MRKYPFLKQWNMIVNIDAENLVIAFSTSNLKFEWKKTFEKLLSPDLAFNMIYIFDPCNTWYHGIYYGLKGFGADSLKTWIQSRIDYFKPKKIITIGSSRGGYGAILLANMLKADGCVALSPQTFFDSKMDKKYGIYQNIERVKKIYPDFEIPNEMIDLKIVLENNPNQTTKYKIFYGEQNFFDVKHMSNLKDNPNVEIIPVETSEHAIGKIIIDDGRFENAVREILK